VIVALVWRDAKSLGVSESAAAEKLSTKDLNALKDLALRVVTNTEKDPNFKNAIGSWKLGHACMMLVSQLDKGVVPNIPRLEQDTIETLVQTAFATMETHT
jgi:hypothetical protein